MFSFLKFEIRGFMSKKVLCYIALCALLMFCGCVKTNKEYLELKNGRIENLQIMKVDEQNHINILNYDLSQQYDKEKEKELLQIYFRNNQSLKETAEELGIHRNTLQYQLDQIAGKCGKNPREFQEAFQLQLALLCEDSSND